MLRQEESSGFFPPKHLPPWHREDSGYSSESQETQFLVFLLLPGLSRLRTVNGTKQKQTGAGAGPHKRQRGQGVAKERHHFPRFISREQRNQPSVLYKNMVAESRRPWSQPPKCPKNEDETKNPKLWGKL